MNELSNRVRTKLGLSGKLTGTGFAFLTNILDGKGWRTHTLVEDVEFSVQCNISGRRIGYIAEAEYSDEQPVKVKHMWHQLCRWTTGGWHVAGLYLFPWLKAMFRRPSMRLFDSYFAILTGMSVAFVLLFAVLAFVIKVCLGGPVVQAAILCLAMFAFVAVVGVVTAWGAVFLSSRKRRPKWWAVLTFPAFSFILSASILWTIVFPTRRWKPIPHGNSTPEEM
jgi:cellulose synthase/poly-beta-1,6-N-acetylglucosamine synthase-like glycosyltransferase